MCVSSVQGGRRATTAVYCPPDNSTAVELVNDGASDLTIGSLNVSELASANVTVPGVH